MGGDGPLLFESKRMSTMPKRIDEESGALKGARQVREAARGNGPAMAGTAPQADFTDPRNR